MAQKYISLDNKIFEILKERCEENKEQDQILLTPALLQHYLEKKHGLNPTMPTIRKNGFGNCRKFEMEYESAEYNAEGDPNRRGLILKPKEFLEEVKQ